MRPRRKESNGDYLHLLYHHTAARCPFSGSAADLRNPDLQVGARHERAPAAYLIEQERHQRRGKAGTDDGVPASGDAAYMRCVTLPERYISPLGRQKEEDKRHTMKEMYLSVMASPMTPGQVVSEINKKRQVRLSGSPIYLLPTTCWPM